MTDSSAPQPARRSRRRIAMVVGAVLVDALLQRQRVTVADPSQPADPEGPRRHRWGRGGHNSVSQSRVSITWRTRPRNAAA